MSQLASPMFVYQCEMSLACTYAMKHPTLAMDCAWHAYDAAIKLGRPDLAYEANNLMAAIRSPGSVESILVVEIR